VDVSKHYVAVNSVQKDGFMVMVTVDRLNSVAWASLVLWLVPTVDAVRPTR